MTAGFVRLIVVICIFMRLAFSTEGNGNTTANSLNDNSFSVILNRDVPYRDEYFIQKLDHFNTGNFKTWNQRYFMVDKFFNEKKKKPRVFLMIGGESAIDTFFIQKGMWIEWAKKFLALCFHLEHRFYGSSLPTKNMSIMNIHIRDASTKNLKKYLNVGQVLKDLAYFIESMNQQKTELKHKRPKWIVFGGSYPGALAALFQKNYAHLVVGAVASSATFPTKPLLPEYFERVGYAIKNYDNRYGIGSMCYDAIQISFDELESEINSGDLEICKKIQKTFHLDPKFNCTDHLQVSLLFQELAMKIDSIFPNKEKLLSFCSSLDDSIDGLAFGFENVFPNEFNDDRQFINTDFELYINFYQNSSWDVVNQYRPRFYQLCTELGGIQSSDSPNQPFGNRFGSDFQLRLICTGIFGPDYNLEMITKGVENVIETYGGKEDFYDKTIFTIGQFDFFLDEQMEIDNPAGNQVIFMEGAFHVDDMVLQNRYNSIKLRNVHRDIGLFLTKLIGGK